MSSPSTVKSDGFLLTADSDDKEVDIKRFRSLVFCFEGSKWWRRGKRWG